MFCQGSDATDLSRTFSSSWTRKANAVVDLTRHGTILSKVVGSVFDPWCGQWSLGACKQEMLQNCTHWLCFVCSSQYACNSLRTAERFSWNFIFGTCFTKMCPYIPKFCWYAAIAVLQITIYMCFCAQKWFGVDSPFAVPSHVEFQSASQRRRGILRDESSPSLAGCGHPSHAQIIDPRDLWRHWFHSFTEVKLCQTLHNYSGML